MPSQHASDELALSCASGDNEVEEQVPCFSLRRLLIPKREVRWTRSLCTERKKKEKFKN
ncbi:hypothetical protein P5673_013161 [Acropora cervicornis]|uniref:Uncharacterized protein n=1 Tax=Acropora cervicornis TaxID=6130 RepID=A0AAD9QM37_ACRCE|nr:hypothetical protein P5673_013161 [Acropora cervicornis]